MQGYLTYEKIGKIAYMMFENTAQIYLEPIHSDKTRPKRFQ